MSVGQCRYGSDAWHRHEAPHGIVTAGHVTQLSVKLCFFRDRIFVNRQKVAGYFL